MSRPLIVVALVVATTSACVQAVPGISFPAVATGAAPYVVTTLVAGTGVPTTERPGGSVDAFVAGRTITVEGWAPGEGGELLVVADRPLTLVSQRRLLRPDAASALGDPQHPALGFRLVLRSPSGPVDRVCVLAKTPAGAPVTRLALSDAALCPPL